MTWETQTVVAAIMPMLAFAFGYGKMSQRVNELSAKLADAERGLGGDMESLRLQTQQDLARVQSQIEKDVEGMELRMRVLETQIQGLRKEINVFKDKMSDAMERHYQLLYEIKGRLDERK